MTLANIAEAIALITGLVQVVKSVTNFNTRYAPGLSVAMGLGIVALYIHPFNSAAIITGLIIGLTSCGLYSGAKTTIQGSSNVQAAQASDTAA